MADNWYYAQDNQQLGPVPLATLQAMARGGQLSSEDLVWREGMANWSAAGQVPGIFGAGAPAPVQGGWQGPAMGGATYSPAGFPAQIGYHSQPMGQSYKKEAVTAFVVSIVGMLICGLIFGLIALNQANKAIAGMDSSGNQEGRGLAVAARVIAIIDLVLWGVGLILRFSTR